MSRDRIVHTRTRTVAADAREDGEVFIHMHMLDPASRRSRAVLVDCSVAASYTALVDVPQARASSEEHARERAGAGVGAGAGTGAGAFADRSGGRRRQGT